MASEELKANILRYKRNPAAIGRAVIGEIEKDQDYVLSDPTLPMVKLLEAGAVMAGAAMDDHEALLRKMYPSLAQTEDDIYGHMANEDYIDRFATPAVGDIYMLIGAAEFERKAVLSEDGSYRKMVIPGSTQITVADYTFSLQYPIEIRLLEHGGYQVVYDVSTTSPLLTLESNVVPWDTITKEGQKMIRLLVRMDQFRVIQHKAIAHRSATFIEEYPLVDRYYYCRVYMESGAGWKELHTTHDEQVHDPYKPTAVLRVYEDRLQVRIPEVYTTTGQMEKNVRVDIYTTKGMINVNLGNYSGSEYDVRWVDLNNEISVYSAPLSDFTNLGVYSTSNIVGGSNGLTFTALRKRVIDNALGDPDLPITNTQIESVLENRGYGVVRNVDTITNRTFQATRRLPAPTDESTVTGINATMSRLQVSIEDIAGNSAVRDNDFRATITPDALFENVNGVTTLLTDANRDAITATAESKLQAANTRRLLYSPFHYVLDPTDNRFECRPYHLDNPETVSRVFVNENSSTLLEVSTGGYVFEKADDQDGYYFTVVTRSGPTYKGLDNTQCHAQLSYLPPGESNRVYLNGEFIGKDAETEERYWRFYIGTNYDVNDEDELFLTSFKFQDDSNKTLPANLISDMDLVYLVTDHAVGSGNNDLDILYATYLLDDPNVSLARGVVHERYRLQFGTAMPGLWSKSRSVVGGVEYERYDSDVPYLYDAFIYERDGNGQIIHTYNAVDEVYERNIIHGPGDPVLADETALSLGTAASATDTTLLFSGAGFVTEDEGKSFVLVGAGTDGERLTGTIVTVTDGDEIVISTPVVTAVDAGVTFLYGTPEVRYHAGDIKHDSSNMPIPLSQRKVLRQVDLFMLDGRYYLATYSLSTQYRDTIPGLIKEWLKSDINFIGKRLLERTELLFYPQEGLGNISVIADGGERVSVDAEQRFSVKYYVTPTVYQNVDLRAALTRTAVSVINEVLSDETVTISELVSRMEEAGGEDIVGVSVDGFIEDTYRAITMIDDSARLSIAKRLALRADGELEVEDAVSVEFVRHSV